MLLTEPRCSRCGQSIYVPLSVRRSRIATWLWTRKVLRPVMTYNLGTWLARRLP